MTTPQDCSMKVNGPMTPEGSKHYFATLAILWLIFMCLSIFVVPNPVSAQSYQTGPNMAASLESIRQNFEVSIENSRLRYENEFNRLKSIYLADLARMSAYWSQTGYYEGVRAISAEIDRVNAAVPFGGPYPGSGGAATSSGGNPFSGPPPATVIVVPDAPPVVHHDCVEIFQHENFNGSSHSLIAPGRYNHRELGIGNDKLSSLIVPRGYEVTLYEHSGFQGRNMKFETGRYHTVGEFNDLTSSINIEKKPRRHRDDRKSGGGKRRDGKDDDDR